MVKKLDLTPERAVTILAAAREHLAAGLSTGPADFDRAQAAVTHLYERAGRKVPYFVRLDSPLAAELYIDLYCRVVPSVKKLLRGQLWDQLRDQLRDQLWGQLGGQRIRYMGTWFWGSMDLALWGWLDGGRRVGAIYRPELDAALNDHLAICHSIGWWYPFDEFCVLTGRPEIIARDDRGRLHSTSGPALRYRDGYALHVHHGVRVPGWIIDRPETIETALIDAETNSEIRRVMIEQYGPDKYLLDSGAKPINRDATGILYRKGMPDDEPIVMVRVLNSTPEADGVLTRDEAIAMFGEDVIFNSPLPNFLGNRMLPVAEADPDMRFKEYMLRVPPGMKTAHEAVAWTFGLSAESYHPAVES